MSMAPRERNDQADSHLARPKNVPAAPIRMGAGQLRVQAAAGAVQCGGAGLGEYRGFCMAVIISRECGPAVRQYLEFQLMLTAGGGGGRMRIAGGVRTRGRVRR